MRTFCDGVRLVFGTRCVAHTHAHALMTEEEEDDDDEEEEDGGMRGGPSYADADDDSDGEEMDDDEAEAESARVEFLKQRALRDEDAKFPDEVDTPLDQPARIRFARFRGARAYAWE